MNTEEPVDLTVPIPADLDTPDKIAWGLTFRQVALLAGAATAAWLAYRLADGVVPPIALLAAAIPYAAIVFAVAVGRRDGLPLDVWLRHALLHLRSPKTLLPGRRRRAPVRANTPSPAAGPLTLPADAIDPAGVIHHGSAAAAIVAVGTVNLELRAPAEQAALIDGFGRWLNSLTTPTQLVLSTRRWDLTPVADRLVDSADSMSDGPLRDLTLDHAAFLYDVAEQADPLRRQILVVHTGRDSTTLARSTAATAAALGTLGAATRILDGPTVTAVLAAACDPYQSPADMRRAVPGQPIRGRS